MANQELIDYIKKVREAGQTDEQTRALLYKSGWQSAEVDDAFAMVNPLPPPTVNQPEIKPEPQSVQSAVINQSESQIKPQAEKLPPDVSKNTSRHSKLWILITGLILLLIVLAGSYFYWQIKPAKVISQTQTQTQNQPNKIANYFEVKEVGLKFVATNDIKDLAYSIKTDAASGTTYVSFSTQSLQTQGGSNCGADQAPLGQIEISQKDPATPGGAVMTYLIKSDNFYVIYGTPQATCSDVKTVQDLQANQLHLLQEALKTIVKADIATTQPQNTPATQPWCHTFNTNLGYANSGTDEVAALHTALQKENISYSPDGTNDYTKATGDGVLQFQIKYGLAQTGYVGLKTKAKLNELYGCAITSTATKAQNTSPTKPSITVISPNGGEKFNPGQTVTISWRTSGADSSDLIDIYIQDTTDGGATYANNGEIKWSLPGNSTSYSWVIPSYYSVQPFSKYKVYIAKRSEGIYDTSDNYFTITSSWNGVPNN
jgi:hypothetical protein